MADITNLESFLNDVGLAIRTKKELTEKIPAENFDKEILSIDTLKGQEKKVSPSVTVQNILPDEGYNALTQVVVEAVTNLIDKNIIPENIKKDISILGVSGTIIPTNNMDLEITSNGIYNALDGYTGLGTVTVNVENKNPQNIPFYMIEQDDEGNLYMVNNYDDILYMAYSIDKDGNFIVNQDDTDNAIYSITKNYELEVMV